MTYDRISRLPLQNICSNSVSFYYTAFKSRNLYIFSKFMTSVTYSVSFLILVFLYLLTLYMPMQKHAHDVSVWSNMSQHVACMWRSKDKPVK